MREKGREGEYGTGIGIGCLLSQPCSRFCPYRLCRKIRNDANRMLELMKQAFHLYTCVTFLSLQ